MSEDHPPAAEPRRPAFGEPVVFRWRKWDGGAHWVHEVVYLGSDQWGDWVGQPVGWQSRRPGREFVAPTPNVTLIPPSGDYAATVNAAPHRVRVYIDLGWDVRWSDTEPAVVEGVDMDLDVVRALDARGTWIDDTDEWDQHRVEYGYPSGVVEHLETRAAELEVLVRDLVAPFDDPTAQAWLDRLASLPLPAHAREWPPAGPGVPGAPDA